MVALPKWPEMAEDCRVPDIALIGHIWNLAYRISPPICDGQDTTKTSQNRRTLPNSRSKQEGKQINRLEHEINRMKLANSRTMSMRGSGRVKSKTAAGMSPSLRAVATSVPQVTAYTIKQTTPPRTTHVERASETIGYITLINGQDIGQVNEFLLNPQELQGTRLSSIAQNFQKFKFRAASLTIASNQPTTVGGQLATGFTNQPEQQFAPGPNAPLQVFSLPGSSYQSLYTPMTVTSSLDLRNPPLFIDATGRDRNTTIQGKFVISPSQMPSSAGNITLPVILNYDCELSEPAILAPPTTAPLVWPSLSFISRDETLGNIVVALAAGETTPLPSFPANVCMQLNPSMSARLNTAAGDDLGDTDLNYLAYTGTSNQFRFYASVVDFNNKTPILNIGTAAQLTGDNSQMPRSTVQRPLN